MTKLHLICEAEHVGDLTPKQLQAFARGLEAGDNPVLTVWTHPTDAPMVDIHASAIEALAEWAVIATNHDTRAGDMVTIYQWWGGHWSHVGGPPVQLKEFDLYHR